VEGTVVEALHEGCSALADTLLFARAQATDPNASMLSALRAQCIAAAAEEAAGVLLESEELVSSTAASPHLWPHVSRVIATHIGLASARLVAVEAEVPDSAADVDHVDGSLDSLLAICQAALTACEAAAAASAAAPSVDGAGALGDANCAPPLRALEAGGDAKAAAADSAPASGVETTQNDPASAAAVEVRDLEARLRRVELALLHEQAPVDAIDDAVRIAAPGPRASPAHPPSHRLAAPPPSPSGTSERDDALSTRPRPPLGARAHAEVYSAPWIDPEQLCVAERPQEPQEPQPQPQPQPQSQPQTEWSFARVHFLAESAILDAHALRRRAGERGARVARERSATRSPTLASRAPVCAKALRALELELERAERAS
jgi:hypothetical protein